MTGSKPWYESTTIQGIIILAFVIIAGKFDLQAGEGERSALREIIIQLGEVIGLAMAFIGRIKAREKVTLKG